MPHPERGHSMDGERYLRHKCSSSSDQDGRGPIPMWDSSDPERARPPLPLNPQSPGRPSRVGTSGAIASAHAALSERARGSNFMPPSTKRSREFNEKAGMNGRTGSHRRLQSSSVRDISMMLEHNSTATSPATRSPERPAFRPTTPPAMRAKSPPERRDNFRDNRDNRDNRETRERWESNHNNTRESKENRFYGNAEANHSAPALPMPSSITPIVRPAVRRPTTQSSILGENTPPQSSTMLALQNMGAGSPAKEIGEPPLSNISNGQKPVPSLDYLSTQIMGLTNIAQSLQREMSALSRRSRDNATDLLSLKEATNTRDEDIRKSLRDLLGNIHDQSARIARHESFGGYFIDSKPHAASPTSARTFNIPRPGSPKSFAESIDRTSISTPSLVGGDGSSVALLEKILRGLGTRDGQESLVSQLSELSERLSGMATAAKVDELVTYIRSHAAETAIVPLNAGRSFANRRMSIEDTTLDLDASGLMSHRLLKGVDTHGTLNSDGKAATILGEDVMNAIRSVKDSLTQSGGLTAEVKSLVRELRGEVLGMGRELGKRLETIGRRQVDDPDSSSASKDEVSRVIDEGLEQMKEQLSHVLREHRRQSASAEKNKNIVDYQEVYNALRNALKDNETARGIPDLKRADVMEAVREAWENYKPEIEVHNIGLGRDEVLECLRQGFQEYESSHQSVPGASRDEVFTAVVDGLKHFVPPQLETPASLSRDEIMEAVRECLEEFEFPLAPSAGGDLTREDMIYAVKEGLNDLDLSRGKALLPAPTHDGEIVEKLNDLMETLKLEFRIISQDNKENATKGGLERLRVAIEDYVDRAAGGSSREAFMGGLLESMEAFKNEVSALVTQANSKSREQLQTELEGLRDIVNSSMVPALPNSAGFNSEEMLETLRNGMSNLHKELMRPRPETTKILDALNEGLSDIRTSLDRISNKPSDLTANDEILDALNNGLKSVKSEIETIRDSGNERALTAWRDPSSKEMALVAADVIKHDDIKNLEVLVTQLRNAVELIEPGQRAPEKPGPDVTQFEEMLRSIQKGIEEIKSQVPSAPPKPAAGSKAPNGSRLSKQASAESEESSPSDGPAASTSAATSPMAMADMPSREDVEAIETIVRNTKSRIDDFFDGEQAVRKEHIDNVETLVLDAREAVRSLNSQMAAKMEAIPHLPQKDDVSSLAALVSKLSEGLGEVKSTLEKDVKNPEKVTKHDVESVEAVTLEIKAAVEGLASMDLSAISTKEDFGKLEAVLRDAKQTFVAYNDSFSRATAERHAEISGVTDRVSEVKIFLEGLRSELRDKLAAGSSGAEALRQMVDSMGDKMAKNQTVGADVREMFALMKEEFEISKEALGGSRIEANKKLEQAADKIRSKIDDKIGELLAKHDQLVIMIDEKGEAAEARDVLTETAISSNKAGTEELKLLIDTLGCTVTESLEKMEEASNTVFKRVEELSARAGEQHIEGQIEHQQTRNQVNETLTAVRSLQGGASEFQPQILATVRNILQLVGDHFEHSKLSATDLRRKVEAQPTSETLRAMVPQHERYDDGIVRDKLDHLINNKYNDSKVHDKLDRIVAHGETAAEVVNRFETLDRVHESVVKSAAELSDFIAAQLTHNAFERDESEKTLIMTTAALEKAQVEKDAVEVTVLRLRDEEEQLRQSIHSLRIENESLIKQRTRLTGDVSSLETALRLRKEELFEMEHRAESLERRILNGIMDHSRMLLYGKAGKKGAEAMNRKRVRRPAAEGQGDQSARPSARSAVAMALAAGRSSSAATGQNGVGRRIVSLGQMNERKRTTKGQASRLRASDAHRGRSWGGIVDSNGFLMEDIDEVDVDYNSQNTDEAVADDVLHVDGSDGEEEEEEEEEEDDEGEEGEEQEGEGEGEDDEKAGAEEEVEETEAEYEDTHEDPYQGGQRRASVEDEIDEGDDNGEDDHDHDHDHVDNHNGGGDGDEDTDEGIDEFARGSEEFHRRVSQSTTVIENETVGGYKEMDSGIDGVYEESIDGDDDDAVLVD